MNIESLEKSNFIIYKILSGSHSYNLNIESSDRDFKGIFVIPPENYLLLERPLEQVNDAGNDISYYGLRRFLELAATANPNIIEMLFVDESFHEYCSEEMKILLQNRDLFISKLCVDPHLRYAEAQIKKARGRNKWVNNPQPVDSPQRSSFCWVTPVQSDVPFRPLLVKDLDLDFSEYEVSSLEHHAGVYRLYKIGAGAKGVFSKDGQVKCQSIRQEDETTKFMGLLTFNEEAFKRALKDHKNYWQWILNRNESRWQQQETGELDYDAKNMMHTLRLLYSGINILEQGQPLVSFSGEKRDFLLAVRRGEFTYDKLIETAEELAHKMRELMETSTIPETVDTTKIDELHLQIFESWQKRVKNGNS